MFRKKEQKKGRKHSLLNSYKRLASSNREDSIFRGTWTFSKSETISASLILQILIQWNFSRDAWNTGGQEIYKGTRFPVKNSTSIRLRSSIRRATASGALEENSAARVETGMIVLLSPSRSTKQATRKFPLEITYSSRCLTFLSLARPTSFDHERIDLAKSR